MSKFDQHLYVEEKIAKQHWMQTVLCCKDDLITVYDIKQVPNNPIFLNPTLSKAITPQLRCEGGREGSCEEGHEGGGTSVTSPTTFVTPRSEFCTSLRTSAGQSRPVVEASSSSVPPRYGR